MEAGHYTLMVFFQGRIYHWCSRCKAPGPATSRVPLRKLKLFIYLIYLIFNYLFQTPTLASTCSCKLCLYVFRIFFIVDTLTCYILTLQTTAPVHVTHY